jgi:GTPase SAR1 family protein
LETVETVGIDIEDWMYPKSRFSFFKSAPKPVHFLMWDFAGEDVYQTAHQYFYSRRSLYLALFRLTDGVQGVEELKPWLRNVQV